MTNTARQPTSEAFRANRPPTMPLIPAIWPLNNIISAVARPMSNPPMSPLTGVKLSTIISFLDRLFEGRVHLLFPVVSHADSLLLTASAFGELFDHVGKVLADLLGDRSQLLVVDHGKHRLG